MPGPIPHTVGDAGQGQDWVRWDKLGTKFQEALTLRAVDVQVGTWEHVPP